MKQLVLSDGSVFFGRPSAIGPARFVNANDDQEEYACFDALIWGANITCRFKTLALAVEGRDQLMKWAAAE